MSIEDHLITEEEFVTCQVCNQKIEKLDGRHFRRHKEETTLDHYRKMFPNSPTITRVKYEKELVSMEKRKVAKSLIDSKTKIVVCYFCKKEIEVNINQSTKESICDDCKSQGKISPALGKAVDGMKKTLMEKHGVDNPSLIKEVVDKRNKTAETKKNLDPNYYSDIVKKRVETLTERFGDDWKEDVQEMRVEGMMKNHGVGYALQVKESVEKFKETYNSKSKEEKKEIIEKGRDTKLEKYGNEKYVNVEKRKETNVEKYGVEFPLSHPDIIEKSKITRSKNMSGKVYKWIEAIGLEILEEYQHALFKHNFKCKNCGHIFIQH